ncbi:hypothetical protein LPB260_19360 [Pseudomonas sp. LPB0260]|uniref:hypothetical protein n=1 Tax=Pseudomonas sp. LPB0260 TaxID=2614442 RepID=UPI0015C26897|nr:hypothetical protein [Pseudomonas sp. LPB0260]QLC72915.1 hypothetical protein LPB260_04410 [Pseudomonas sp. LPB0260]QLC75689.1 hypothetical protein LPB260_19360 [Pseudomonas sp. LPB0260]
MRTQSFFRQLLIWTLGVLATLPPLAYAEAASAQVQVQVYASRATSSLMLLRGEGFQKSHRQRLENDIQTLAAAVHSLPQSSDVLRASHLELVVQLRRGVSFGPGEENMPWGYPKELSKALRDFLHAARQLPSSGESELSAKIEYLAVQYLSRSYMGSFEIAREQPGTYLGQDERLLIPAVDQELAALGAQGSKFKVRWEYLKAALSDMNSQSNTLESVSGRPFAPITVDRHSRALSQQWMATNP